MSSKIEIIRVCEYCGNQFTARTTKTRFCSHTCNGKSYKERLKNEKIESSNRQSQKINIPIEDLNKKEFLSVNQAAKLIGCSRQTFYNLINTGRVKAVNLKIKKTVVKRSEIDKLFN
jgi:excisionase family DNA binding protein